MLNERKMAVVSDDASNIRNTKYKNAVENANKLVEEKRLMMERAQKIREEAAKEAQAQAEAPEAPDHGAVPGLSQAKKKLIYAAYPYGQTPDWGLKLKTFLRDQGYLCYLPTENVEEQFHPDDLPDLQELPTALAANVSRLFQLPEALNLPLTHQSVVPAIKSGDTGFDTHTLIFKELYFLIRSSVVLVDVGNPCPPETVAKLYYCKFLDIPTIGFSISGQAPNPWVVSAVKAVLTAPLTPANLMPFIKGYTAV